MDIDITTSDPEAVNLFEDQIWEAIENLGLYVGSITIHPRGVE